MRLPLSLLAITALLAGGPALAFRPTPEDMAAKKAELFTAADADHDGALTFAEFEQLAEQHRAERLQRHFDRMDTNGDGRVSADEFQAARPHRGGCRHGDRP